MLYANFVMFFPQLVAGPILRASEVTAQLSERPALRVDDLSEGLRRVVGGLFLKVVLADNIAPLVDEGFAMRTESMPALDVWTLAFLFGFQIYFDFSAYSHIALGSARMMGIHFPENFAFPYGATSPRDFWKRWHISLSSWIRDYLYLPLCGTKVLDHSQGGLVEPTGSVTESRRSIALFATWAIMGLWHGAAWTFVLWGLHHAVAVYFHRKFGPRIKQLPAWLRQYGGWAITLPVMMLAWVPFRAASLGDALRMYAKVLTPSAYGSLGMRENTYLVAALLTAFVIGAELTQARLLPALRVRPRVYAALETGAQTLVIALVFVFFRPVSQFIYFQF